MDDASNPFAPLTPAELTEAALQGAQSEAGRGGPPTCPPADAEPGALAAARLRGRKPDRLWHYPTAEDETAFYAARWNDAGGKKTFRPVSWNGPAGWQFEAWPDHRPLFRLPDLISKPKAPVVICEGEKAAEAAAAIFPNSIATTSSGGAGAAAKTNWTPLAGRSILIWPDHDEAGAKYAREVATILAALGCSVSIIDARALAAIDPADGAREPREKWDAADAKTEWPDLAALRKTAVGLRKAYDPDPAFVSYGPYDMTAEGLHVEGEKGRGDNKTKASEWVAAPFEILGACRDPHGRAWGKYLRWRDGDGRPHVGGSPLMLPRRPGNRGGGIAMDARRAVRRWHRPFLALGWRERRSPRAAPRATERRAHGRAERRQDRAKAMTDTTTARSTAPSASALRMRRHRERRRDGLRSVMIELRASEIDALGRRGLLRAGTHNNGQAIKEALYVFLDQTLGRTL